MADTEDAADVQVPVVTFKKRAARGKANIRAKPASPPPHLESDASASPDDDDGGDDGPKIKRRKRNAGLVTASSSTQATSGNKDLSATVFVADRSIPISSSNDATKASNWYDEDAKRPKEVSKVASKKSFGPVKAPPTNIRTITITDFAGDVCKDWKQVGFCGYGDNCKYLHAREDYKHGWQLDKEWDIVTKGKKNLGGTVVASADRSKGQENDEDDEDGRLDDIPFACIICRESYKEPIITRCGHYFCEPCALKRYRKDPNCAACGSGTNGVFNSAKRLKKLLEKKREREAAAARDDSDDQDEDNA